MKSKVRQLMEAIPDTVSPDLTEPIELTENGEVVGVILSKEAYDDLVEAAGE